MPLLPGVTPGLRKRGARSSVDSRSALRPPVAAVVVERLVRLPELGDERLRRRLEGDHDELNERAERTQPEDHEKYREDFGRGGRRDVVPEANPGESDEAEVERLQVTPVLQESVCDGAEQADQDTEPARGDRMRFVTRVGCD